MKLFFFFVMIEFYKAVTSSLSFSGHTTLPTARKTYNINTRQINTSPLYWKFDKIPGIGHGMEDLYDYTEKIPSQLQTNNEGLRRLHHSKPIYNRTVFTPTANIQDKVFTNEKLLLFRPTSKTPSTFENRSNFTIVEADKKQAKINSPKNYIAFVWFPALDSIAIKVNTETENSSRFATVPDEASVKASPDVTLHDRRMTSEHLDVKGQNRSPRIYSIGRGLSSYLSAGNGDILPMYIFDVPNRCPPRHQLDSQGRCRQIFTFDESVLNQDSMYSLPAKTNLDSKQNSTFTYDLGANEGIGPTTSTFSSNAEEFSDKSVEKLGQNDVVVVALNKSADQSVELQSVYQESGIQQSVNEPVINGSANQGSMYTNSAPNSTNDRQLFNTTEDSGSSVESLSNFNISESTTPDDFFFDFFDFKLNNSNSSLWNLEGNSSGVFEFYNATDLSNKENRAA